jgi:hypothetical protein
MPHAVIRDVPASWEHYASFARAINDPVPEELILHVAGPTDEGFRTIEIWASRESWRRHCDDRLDPDLPDGLWAPATLRELEAVAAVVGLGLEQHDKPKEGT